MKGWQNGRLKDQNQRIKESKNLCIRGKEESKNIYIEEKKENKNIYI